MGRLIMMAVVGVGLTLTGAGRAAEPKETKPVISDYFPPPESKGGWRTLLPDKGEPDAEQKAAVAKIGGVDWDKLKEAWDYNARPTAPPGLLVIRHGQIVGEWYKDGDRDTDVQHLFQFQSVHQPGLRPDPVADIGSGTAARRQEADAGHQGVQRGMAAGVAAAARPAQGRHHGARTAATWPRAWASRRCRKTPEPFEWALGHVEGSPFAKLKNDPGKAFHYSNAGVAHLVLVFHRATGEDLYPFLKERMFDPIGMENRDMEADRRRRQHRPVQPGL